MRVECDRCHRVGLANLRVVPADAPDARPAIVHLCEVCGAESRYTAAPPAPPPPDQRVCPKCEAPRVDGAACPRCGLAADRMDGYVVTEEVPASLTAAWETCRAAWDDPAGHDRLAELALTYERYPWLARHYRTVLRERPDDAVAASRVQRIARMAEAAMRATASPSVAVASSRGGLYAILIVVVLCLAAASVYAVRVVGARQVLPAGGTRVPAESRPTRPPIPHRSIESRSTGR